MAKALYRKYRPTKLTEVIGQSQVTDILSESLKKGKISHAYLFIGPRGTGKTSVARIFAHEINGFDYQIEDDYVDIIEIDGASNRGIDNIRELREKAMIAPTSGKYKIYIIDEVHMLTKEAFNALLKTLEEPPSHIIFIMATTDAYKVPVTITSRAQTYTFKLADHDTMFKHLKSIAEQESIQIDDDALDIVVKRGGGSFRDSLSLLDQISTLSDQQITKESVISALGLPEDTKITELLATYQSGDVVKITTELKDLLSSGVKPETIAEEIINHIIDNPNPDLFPLLATLPEVKAPFPEAKLLLCFVSQNLVSASKPTSRLATSPSRLATNTPKTAPTKATSAQKDIPKDTPPAATSTTQEMPKREDFLNKVKDANDAIYLQLNKSILEFANGIIDVYPPTKICETILTSKNNKAILDKLAGNTAIKIHPYGEKPENYAKDQTIDKISAIMGGEVKNDGGKNPF